MVPLVGLVIEPIEMYASSEHIHRWWCGQGHEMYIDTTVMRLEWSCGSFRGSKRVALCLGDHVEFRRGDNDVALLVIHPSSV